MGTLCGFFMLALLCKYGSTFAQEGGESRRKLRGQRFKGNCSVQKLNWFSCIFRSLSAPQKMSDLLQNGSSRYKEEFVEITRLGKGGFGSVFKVCMS